MHVWLALRRLLPLLAVLSLVLTPVTAPAAAASMHAPMAQAHGSVARDHDMAGTGHAHMGHHAVASAAVAMAGMDMEDMPCCPHEKAAKPDCAKGCPLMALCLATVASLLPATIALPVPVGTRAALPWPSAATFDSLHGTPLPEPPRA